MRNKCDKLGFEHAWEDITPNIIYTSNPPQYPSPVRRCKNCGKQEKEDRKSRKIKRKKRIK